MESVDPKDSALNVHEMNPVSSGMNPVSSCNIESLIDGSRGPRHFRRQERDRRAQRFPLLKTIDVEKRGGILTQESQQEGCAKKM